MRLVRLPEELVDASDSPRLSEAKRALISHRTQAIRSLAVVPLLLCLGFGLMTPFPFYCLVFAFISLLMLLARGIL